MLRALLPAALALLLFAGSALATGNFTDVSLGAAGASGLNLQIFVVGPTTMSASNSGTLFNGNLGLAGGASTNFSGGGTLTGNVYKDPGASVQSNLAGQFNVGGLVVTQSLEQARLDVIAAWSAARMLTPDQTYGAIGSTATTLNATGALNASGGRNTVVSITGGINISNPSKNLTIHGGVNDFFIINVDGDLAVSNGQINTSGGIPSSHILFNLSGSLNDLAVSNGSSLITGTFLAPNPGQQLRMTPGTLNGALIGYAIQTSSGPIINPGVFVPAPGSGALLLGLTGAGLLRRRRNSRSK